MISCTEFIPSYSELFAFLEEKYGRGEVDRFWKFLFAPTGESIPLVNFVKREGIRGCYDYWSGTLNEEAADFTMYLNEKAGWFMIDMHACPSKGRLLKLEKELGLKPYHDYCLHCDSYRAHVAQAGLRYVYNFAGIDHAACSLLIYDPAVFDGRVIVDADTLVMDRKASQNEYFHRDFHSSMNNGVEYLGSNYGESDVREYLTRYVKHVYPKRVEAIRAGGLAALADQLRDTYTREKADDALTLTLTPERLDVSVAYCPAVRHLRATGRRVSDWYRCTTEIVMEVLAEESGIGFAMDSYDPDSGAARYHFSAARANG